VKADKGIREVLEHLAAEVTGAVKGSLEGIETAMNAPGAATSHCIGDLNAAEEVLRPLRPYINAERNAPDLDAYRRTNYSFLQLSFFTDVLLGARQNRAACNAPLQVIKQGLTLLSGLTLHHPDYCRSLRQSASYEKVSKIGFPGFACSSDGFHAFGTSAETRLAEATYPLHMQDNIFGFDDDDAESLRPAIQSLDSQLRLKEIVCTRQLGAEVSVPRTADACNIPVPF
jgi:hypothetical protein